MQDAVAEVFQERQHLDQGFSTGLLLSIFLHALLLIPFAVSAMNIVRAPAEPIRVRLAAAEPSELRQPATGTAPVIETPARPTPPQQTATPQAPAETPRPETRELEKSLFGQSPEKPVDRKAENDRERAAPAKREPQTPVPATPSAVEPGPPSPATTPAPGISVGGGSAQISGLEGGDFPYTFYVERMLGIIGGNWFRPEAGSRSGATIYFVIERNGKISEVEIRETSGNSTFDRAARRAVIESSPLPPLPFQYAGSELGVHLKFN